MLIRLTLTVSGRIRKLSSKLLILIKGVILTLKACLVSQLVKNPPAMQETRVRSLGWEDPLEKGKATHSSILDWKIPWFV